MQRNLILDIRTTTLYVVQSALTFEIIGSTDGVTTFFTEFPDVQVVI